MIREEKLISIAVLTVLLYALGILLDASFFLIPFPLFDLIFFAVFVQFLFWNRNAIKGYIWIYFSAALLQVFYNPLFLGVALSSAHLNQLDDFLIVDVLKLVSKLLLIATLIFWRFQRKLKFPLLIVLFFSLFVMLGMTEDFFWISPLAPAIVAFQLWREDQRNPFRYLWILQSIFDFFTVVMLHYAR
ncbi:MAG: hypothetical protein ACPG9L_01395 [Crocinitomicaceae bacterium]